MKKLISYLITAMMVFTMIPSIAFAETAGGQQMAENPDLHSEQIDYQYAGSMNLHIEQSNPLYGGYSEPIVETVDVAHLNENGIAPNGSGDATYVTTAEEATKILREQMVNRQTTVTINMPVTEADLTESAMNALTSEIFTSAMKHTGKVNEGDSLQWVWQDQWTDISVTGDANGLIATITYTITYYTTAEQEAALSEAVAALKTELNLDDKSDYEKVKAIYNYMTANITYDYANYSNDSYMLKYSAYAALVNKTSVCQGYATLFYRMMCEYGIDARLVAGTSINAQGEQEAHSWNIVKLGSKYYYLDATWDSTYDADTSSHNFFLKGTSNFANHTLEAQFVTPEFTSAYPMSETDYVPGTDEEQGGSEGEEPDECTHTETETIPAVAATCTSKGLTEGVKCASCGEVLTPQEEVGMADHSYDEGVVTTEPTTTTEGVKTYTCTVCGDTKAEEIPMLEPVIYNYDAETKTLTFSGNGMIVNDINEYEASWHVYKDVAETLIIENGITGIEAFSFANFVKLEDIIFPDEMNALGQQAFDNCDSLVEVKLPNGISFLDAAFTYCDNLQKVVFGEFEAEWGYVFVSLNPFYCSPNVKTIIVPENNDMLYVEDGVLFTKYSNETFDGYDQGLYCYPPALNQEAYTIPDGIEKIHSEAFGNCKYLKRVQMSDSVTIVEDRAFSYCDELEEVHFSQNIKSFAGKKIFDTCKKMKVVINESSAQLPLVPFSLNEKQMAGWKIDGEGLFIDQLSDGIAKSVAFNCPEWMGAILEIEGYARCEVLFTKEINADILNSSEKLIGSIHIQACKEFTELPELVTYNDWSYEISEIEKVDHNVEVIPGIDATCTMVGVTESKRCIVCGEVIQAQEVIPATGHTYGEWIVDTEATCTKDGSQHKVCACGDKVTETIKVLGHDKVQHAAKAVSCTEPGWKAYETCSRCEYTTYKEIPATDHTYGDIWKTDADKHWHACACGAKSDEAAHDYEWIIDLQPTEDTEGSKHQECTVCGAEGETASIDKLDHTHNMIKTDAVAATCTADGNIEYYTCSKCGKLYADTDGKKEITKDDTVIPTTGHTWSEDYIVCQPATMNKEGHKAICCTVCGAVSEDSIDIPQIKSATMAALAYNGSTRKPDPKVINYYKNTRLKNGVDYTVVYKDAKAKKVVKPKIVGTYTAVITFKGEYGGTIKRTFNINPKATSINKLTKPAKKQIKVTWQKRTAQVTGYEIRYSTTKGFTKGTTKTLKVKNYKTTAATIKNLKSNKKYWVQVRTYKNVNGKVYYSAWSKAKTVTTK